MTLVAFVTPLSVVHRLIESVRTQAADGCLAFEPESFFSDLPLLLSALLPESELVAGDWLDDSLDDSPDDPLVLDPSLDDVLDDRLSVR